MIISRSGDDLPLKASDATHAMSYSTAETTTCNSSPYIPKKGPAGLEESIDRLERQTEYLIRNMCFDNVALQSRDEDMRKTIVNLEDELRSLQKMIDESDSSCKNLGSEEEIAGPLNSENNLISHQQKRGELINKNSELNDISQDSLDLPMGSASASEKDTHTKQQFRGIFHWGNKGQDRKRLSSSLGSTASESNSTVGSIAGRRRTRNVDANKEQSALDEVSLTSHAASVSSAPLFQWFGDPDKSRRRECERVKRRSNVFHKLFQRHPMNDVDNDGISNLAEITEENSRRNNMPYNKQDDFESEAVRANILHSLNLKLRGCDLAKSSLNELHTLQSRCLLDWQRDHTHKQIDCEVESNQVYVELEDIRNKFSYCQKENKRRQRLLKEAIDKTKKANDRAELLQEEVECVRTELFALNRKMSERYCYD